MACFLPAAPVPAASRLHAVPLRLSARRAAPLRSAPAPPRRVRVPSATSDDAPKSKTGFLSPSAEALLLVNAVPFLWGTYTPLIKIVTNLNPHAPLIALNFLTAVIGSTAVAVIRAVTHTPGDAHEADDEASRTPFAVSAELGSFLAIAAIFHLASFSGTTPSRASFLVQLTSLFVPLLDLLTGAKVSRAVLGAASLTVLGAAVLAVPTDLVNAANAADSGASIFSSVRPGDILAVISAFFYSVQIVRTDRLAPRGGSLLNLTNGTLLVQSVCAGTFVAVAALMNKISFSGWLTDMQHLSPHEIVASVLSMLWIGGMTSGFSLWAQVEAQERVGASRASIFFATQPVWSVGLAVAAGLDALSTSEIIGGSMIVLGGFLLATGGELEKA